MPEEEDLLLLCWGREPALRGPHVPYPAPLARGTPATPVSRALPEVLAVDLPMTGRQIRLTIVVLCLLVTIAANVTTCLVLS